MRPAAALLPLALVACDRPAAAPAEPSAAPPPVSAPVSAPATAPEPAPEPPAELVWLDDEAEARARSESTGKPLFVDFAADWCAPCKQLDAVTFADEAVRARLAADFVLLKLDVTEQTDADLALQEAYEATALPALRVRAADGRLLLRIDRFVPPEALLADLAELASM